MEWTSLRIAPLRSELPGLSPLTHCLPTGSALEVLNPQPSQVSQGQAERPPVEALGLVRSRGRHLRSGAGCSLEVLTAAAGKLRLQAGPQGN